MNIQKNKTILLFTALTLIMTLTLATTHLSAQQSESHPVSGNKVYTLMEKYFVEGDYQNDHQSLRNFVINFQTHHFAKLMAEGEYPWFYFETSLEMFCKVKKLDCQFTGKDWKKIKSLYQKISDKKKFDLYLSQIAAVTTLANHQCSIPWGEWGEIYDPRSPFKTHSHSHPDSPSHSQIKDEFKPASLLALHLKQLFLYWQNKDPHFHFQKQRERILNLYLFTQLLVGNLHGEMNSFNKDNLPVLNTYLETHLRSFRQFTKGQRKFFSQIKQYKGTLLNLGTDDEFFDNIQLVQKIKFSLLELTKLLEKERSERILPDESEAQRVSSLLEKLMTFHELIDHLEKLYNGNQVSRRSPGSRGFDDTIKDTDVENALNQLNRDMVLNESKMAQIKLEIIETTKKMDEEEKNVNSMEKAKSFINDKRLLNEMEKTTEKKRRAYLNTWKKNKEKGYQIEELEKLNIKLKIKRNLLLRLQ